MIDPKKKQNDDRKQKKTWKKYTNIPVGTFEAKFDSTRMTMGTAIPLA